MMVSDIEWANGERSPPLYLANVALGEAGRVKKYTSSREEEGKGAQMCPCGEAKRGRTYITGECEAEERVFGR